MLCAESYALELEHFVICVCENLLCIVVSIRPMSLYYTSVLIRALCVCVCVCVYVCVCVCVDVSYEHCGYLCVEITTDTIWYTRTHQPIPYCDTSPYLHAH